MFLVTVEGRSIGVQGVPVVGSGPACRTVIDPRGSSCDPRRYHERLITIWVGVYGRSEAARAMRQGRDATTVTTTMERRKFTIGLGALATGSAAAIGTGAFTSVEADRDIAVDIADDADAFLGMEPIASSPNSAYADVDDGVIELDLSDSNDDHDSAFNGTGVNKNATTNILDIFKITNQGTQKVYVSYDSEELGQPDDDDLYVDLVTNPDSDYTSDSSIPGTLDPAQVPDGVPLDTGESVAVGLFIITRNGSTPDDLDETVTIVAEAE